MTRELPYRERQAPATASPTAAAPAHQQLALYEREQNAA